MMCVIHISQKRNKQMLSKMISPPPPKKLMLQEAYSNHLQGTEVCFQAMSNQNGVSADEAQ